MRNGKLSEQTMLERGIEEKGYGLWRTPNAHPGMRGAKRKEGYEDSLKNGTLAINLLDQERHNFQPTFYPTPTARDYFPPRLPETMAKKDRNPLTNSLPDRIQVEQKEDYRVTGQLNPAWVERLMGYPIGWTDLEE